MIFVKSWSWCWNKKSRVWYLGATRSSSYDLAPINYLHTDSIMNAWLCSFLWSLRVYSRVFSQTDESHNTSTSNSASFDDAWDEINVRVPISTSCNCWFPSLHLKSYDASRACRHDPWSSLLEVSLSHSDYREQVWNSTSWAGWSFASCSWAAYDQV